METEKFIPNGILLIVGGHEDKGRNNEWMGQGEHRSEEILASFVELTGKPEPVIEVVTTASADASASFDEYEKAFRGLGVKHPGHIHHDIRAEVLADNLTERINKADAVYFAGGDQLKLTSVYGGTDFLFKLKKRYVSGGLIVGGTSAGAMAFSTPMIFAGNQEVQQIASEVRITTGSSS